MKSLLQEVWKAVVLEHQQILQEEGGRSRRWAGRLELSGVWGPSCQVEDLWVDLPMMLPEKWSAGIVEGKGEASALSQAVPTVLPWCYFRRE